MLTKKILTVLAAAASLTCLTATNALAQTVVVSSTSSTTLSGSRLPDDVLVTRYTLLTGSKANATSLVTGLRTGSVVTLTSTGSASTATFTPTTKLMGYGNIKIALSLAKTTLAKQGIANPTPEQLAAALNGGNVTLTNGTIVTLTGILTQRSAGMGWGKIAQNSGVKLGSVVSASQTEHALKEDKKITLVKTKDTAKDTAKDMAKASDKDDSTSHVKGSSTSSSTNSHSSGSGTSSGGGSSNGGKSSSGTGGGNGGGNSGGNGGGGKK